MSTPDRTFAGVLDNGQDVIVEEWDGAFILRVRELDGFRAWSAPVQLDPVLVTEVTG